MPKLRLDSAALRKLANTIDEKDTALRELYKTEKQGGDTSILKAGLRTCEQRYKDALREASEPD